MTAELRSVTQEPCLLKVSVLTSLRCFKTDDNGSATLCLKGKCTYYIVTGLMTAGLRSMGQDPCLIKLSVLTLLVAFSFRGFWENVRLVISRLRLKKNNFFLMKFEWVGYAAVQA